MHLVYDTVKRLKMLLPLLIITLFYYYCAEEEKTIVFSESEVIRLLSGDTTKSWIRFSKKINGQDQELSECDLHVVTKFYIGDLDSLKYSIGKYPSDCGGDNTIIDEGIWQIISAESDIDNARIIEFISKGDTLTKNIDEITSLLLRLDWVENESQIEESFMVLVEE